MVDKYQRWCDNIRKGRAKAKAAGRLLGRPRFPVDDENILDLRSQGLSLTQIAERLNTTVGLVRYRLRLHELEGKRKKKEE